MMLWSPALAVVPVTIHVALREAHRAADDARLIVETCTIAVAELKRRFGIANPRLAVSGLNPHAGEDGTLGTEDSEIVAPAVAILKPRPASMRAARCPRTRCSTRRRARPTTARSACITIRR